MFNLSSLKILPTRGDVSKTPLPSRTPYLQFSWFRFYPRRILLPLLGCINSNIQIGSDVSNLSDSALFQRSGSRFPSYQNIASTLVYGRSTLAIERWKGNCLCSHSEDSSHEFNPFFDGSFLHFFYLLFLQHVHNLVSFDWSSHRVE